ncbi:hypothetical protein ACH5RR_026649 [Cinchona calisaya]|uniref:Reverse transcriptase n=1 Tax=Cinchona calisaya TaxID=153742 RepID=A0ABD2Z745_9GENT
MPSESEDFPIIQVGTTPTTSTPSTPNVGSFVSSSLSRRESLSSSESSDETPPRKFRSLREIYESIYASFIAKPTNFEEAIKEEVWCNAMKEEFAAIEKNKTWELVDLPNGKHAIGVKWVLRQKAMLMEAFNGIRQDL